MSLEDLRSKFIVDDDVLRGRLETIVTKALRYCVIDKKGNVHFNDSKLTTRQRMRLTLAARALAAQMDEKISPEVSVDELVASTGLPRDQVRARAAELVRTKLARSPRAGIYAAVPYRVEALIDSAAGEKKV
jgi:hypothetical protein